VKLLDSLLDAIVRLEGDALVMHVGEKPYVITASASMNAYRGPLAWGQVELSSRVLTFDAMSTMLAQILPLDQQRALDEFGAIEHEILPPDGILDRFTVVAARGGEDVWVEVRRKPLPPPVVTVPAESHTAPEPEPEPVREVSEPIAPDAPVQSSELTSDVEENDLDNIVVILPGQHDEEVSLDAVPDNAIQVLDDEPQDVPTEEEVDAMLAATASALLTSGLNVDYISQEEEEEEEQEEEEAEEAEEAPPAPSEPVFQLSPPEEVFPPEEEAELEVAEPRFEIPPGAPLFSAEAEAAAAPEPHHAIEREPISTPAIATAIEEEPSIVVSEMADVVVDSIEITQESGADRTSEHSVEMRMDPTIDLRHAETAGVGAPSPLSAHSPSNAGSATSEGPIAGGLGRPHASAAEDDDDRQRVVVPMSRPTSKPEIVSAPFTPSEDAALMRTLRAAAARGAATVYVVAQSKPMIRVDGEITALETEPLLTGADVERLVLELAPPRKRDALLTGPVEWLCDVPEIGRVRCQTFRDHRGPGVLFWMFPLRAISADQLGLTGEVQALCQQSDGLVLVTGARASGKSTLLNAFVDLINRTRCDHVITVETQIGFVHESRRSFISQRETRGDAELAASVARAALGENPDVMMIEDLKSADVVATALDAAESGRLVLASVPGASTIAALERLVELFPADRRARARMSLATALRGVVAQILLRRVTGGLVAAREILLNTPAVSTLVLEGKMFQLPVALDSGRRLGMIPMTDALATHVREGTVHAGEAYRKALDRAALVAALKRDGVDTSFAERMA
jgi:twitching motility protein PilT